MNAGKRYYKYSAYFINMISLPKIVVILLLLFQHASPYNHDKCTVKPLGMENGLIKDDQITASSQHDEESVGPKRARIRTDIEGGAFCPKEMINRDQNYEFLSIDLKKVFVISAIELQGRYANGSGREFTPYFKIEYLRKNSSWIRYKSRSKKTIFVGNTDTFTPVYISLDPPIVASKVRIVPWSNSSRMVCLRTELYGCENTDGLMYYSFSPEPSKEHFDDTIFEDTNQNDAILLSKRGLGLLTDGVIGDQLDSPFRNYGNDKFVGWKYRKSKGADEINFLFEFEKVRSFSYVMFYGFGSSISRIDLSFGLDAFNIQPNSLMSHLPKKVTLNGSVKSHGVLFKEYVPLYQTKASIIRITIKYMSDWLLLSEINFDSKIGSEETIEGVMLNNLNTSAISSINNSFSNIPDSIFDLNGFNSFHVLLMILVFCMILIFGLGCVFVYVKDKQFRKGQFASNTVLSTVIGSSASSRKSFKSNLMVSAIGNGCNKTSVYDDLNSINQHQGLLVQSTNGTLYVTENASATNSPYRIRTYHKTKRGSEEDSYTSSTAASMPLLKESKTISHSMPCKPIPPTRSFNNYLKNAQSSSTFSSIPKTENGEELHYASSSISLANPYSIPPDDINCANENIIIENLIGEGKFTIINKGYIKHLKDRAFAIKSLKICDNDAATYALQCEADLMSLCNHSNIISFYGFNECMALVMEYADYGNLRQYVNNQRNNINESILISITTGLASGLKYLESNKLVHGHLSPKCCLVKSEGGNHVVKISSIRGGSHHAQLRYSSPESILSNTWSNKSDVYSFSVTIFELFGFFEDIPFGNFTNKMLVDNAQAQLENLESALYLDFKTKSNVPHEMADILNECFNSDFDQRPTFLEIHLFLSRKSLSFYKLY